MCCFQTHAAHTLYVLLNLTLNARYDLNPIPCCRRSCSKMLPASPLETHRLGPSAGPWRVAAPWQVVGPRRAVDTGAGRCHAAGLRPASEVLRVLGRWSATGRSYVASQDACAAAASAAAFNDQDSPPKTSTRLLKSDPFAEPDAEALKPQCPVDTCPKL